LFVFVSGFKISLLLKTVVRYSFPLTRAAPLQFRWESVNTEVASLAPIYTSPSGNHSLQVRSRTRGICFALMLPAQDEAGFSARLLGHLPGTTRVTVQLLITPENRKYLNTATGETSLPDFARSRLTIVPGGDFTASLLITVIEPLRILCEPTILLPPNSRYLIRTNRDSSQVSRPIDLFL
jgi:hypothetical protein